MSPWRMEKGIFKCDRSDSVQDCRTDSFRMLPHVDKGSSCPVRPAYQVDLIIAKCQADFVQIICSHTCGILSQVEIFFQLLKTGSEIIYSE